MSAYSPGVRPSSTAREAWSGRDGALKAVGHGFEDLEAVRAPGQRVDRVLGVGHEAEDVALGVDHARDVVHRPVGVLARRVAEDDLLGWELACRRVEAAGGVLDGDREAVASRTRARERRAPGGPPAGHLAGPAPPPGG